MSTSTVASPWSGFLRHSEVDNNSLAEYRFLVITWEAEMFNQRLLRLNQKLTGKKLKIIQHDLNYHIMNSDPNTESTINHNTTHNTTRKHQRVSSEDGFLFFNLRSNFRFNPTYTHEPIHGRISRIGQRIGKK